MEGVVTLPCGEREASRHAWNHRLHCCVIFPRRAIGIEIVPHRTDAECAVGADAALIESIVRQVRPTTAKVRKSSLQSDKLTRSQRPTTARRPRSPIEVGKSGAGHVSCPLS
jgi:hypothetical protein